MWTRITAAAALMLAAGTAGAATVTQSQVLTEDGQDLTFTFSGLPAALGSGLVTIFTGASAIKPGVDLDSTDVGFPQEFFELTLDGASRGLFSCGGAGAGVGATEIPGATGNPSFSNCQFSLPVLVGSADLASFLADGRLSVGVLFSAGVSSNALFGDADVVGVTLDYEEAAAIPLPASGLLLLGAVGAAGLAARRRAG